MGLAAAAGITAVGAIGGAMISSSSQSHAANQAADAQQQATNAQLQLGRESNAQNLAIYNENKALLNPFVQRGNVAGESINALLGLPAQAANTNTAPPATTPGGSLPAPGAALPPGASVGSSVGSGLHTLPGLTSVTGPANINAPVENKLALREAGQPVPVQAGLAQTATPATGASTTGTPATGTQPVNALSATDAFNNFANSAGMQFQLQQGEHAINQGYAARGQLQSGAALKALQGYGQSTALNNYFLPYMSLLGGQQSTGAQAGAAVAGVGSNFANTAAGINGQMAGYIGNGADAASNAALARGYAGAQLGSSVGSALGTLGSSFFQPSSGAGAGMISGGTSTGYLGFDGMNSLFGGK